MPKGNKKESNNNEKKMEGEFLKPQTPPRKKKDNTKQQKLKSQKKATPRGRDLTNQDWYYCLYENPPSHPTQRDYFNMPLAAFAAYSMQTQYPNLVFFPSQPQGELPSSHNVNPTLSKTVPAKPPEKTNTTLTNFFAVVKVEEAYPAKEITLKDYNNATVELHDITSSPTLKK